MTIRNVVTGAFSYTGKHVAERLLAMDEEVVTLTNHPDRPDPFDGAVEAIPYAFDDPAALAESFRGAQTLYTTYWIRFARGTATFENAVANTRTLLAAAKDAGVQRVVHVSVTNASLDSQLPYFAGKAQQEDLVRASGLSYAIVRPTQVYGSDDVLVTNIAWFLRRFPVFPIANGDYRVQPVSVDDLADLMVSVGHENTDRTLDATGPDVLTFRALVETLRDAMGTRSRIVEIPASLLNLISKGASLATRDTVLTPDEIRGLTASLLVVDGPPTTPTRFADWAASNATELGLHYASEIQRHF
jgi:NADH dehydrogenase